MKTSRFKTLTLTTTIATLIQIGSGGLVRATDSGEGCPDWPKCFGRWIPPLDPHALIEYAHRFIASIAIILVLATAVTAVIRFRKQPRLLWSSVLAALTIIGLAGIGAAVVKTGLNETLVSIHIAIAMALVGALVYATVNARLIDRPSDTVDPISGRLTTAALVATFLVIIIGADVRGSGAALIFPDWPLMNGRLIPVLGGLATRHFLHRAAVLLDGILLAWLIVRTWRAIPRHRGVAIFAVLAGGLYVIQAIIGAAQIWTTLAAAPVALHVWLSSLIWAALVAAFTLSRHARVAPRAVEPASGDREPLPISGGQFIASPNPPIAFWDRTRAYIALTKPRIIELLLVTTVPTMILAQRGMPSVWLIVATLIGGTLAAGSANSINCYLDRDIDAVMHRTQARPLPQHSVEPRNAVVFGAILGVVSFIWLIATVNLLSAVLASAAIFFYVFVYTLMLKRTTPQNIVIGGAAGAVPVLVGWAAVTGRITAAPIVLFLIIYYWTPPHFWALAMRYSDDYEAARVPMLPVIASEHETTKQIMIYSILLVAVTLLFAQVADMGAVYTISAAILGAAFIGMALRLRKTKSVAAAMGLFKYSISYLTLLFAAIALDVFVHIG